MVFSPAAAQLAGSGELATSQPAQSRQGRAAGELFAAAGLGSRAEKVATLVKVIV
jgi:hypothetical protein